MSLVVRRVGAEAAEAVHAVVRAAFAARPPLDPPADALAETPETLAAALAAGGGLLATLEGRPVGALVLAPARRDGVAATVRRAAGRPAARRGRRPGGRGAGDRRRHRGRRAGPRRAAGDGGLLARPRLRRDGRAAAVPGAAPCPPTHLRRPRRRRDARPRRGDRTAAAGRRPGGAVRRAGGGQDDVHPGARRRPRRAGRRHVADVRDRPRAPVADRGARPRARRRLPARRHRRARRPRPRRLPRRGGHGRRVGHGHRRGAGRLPPRGPHRPLRRAAPRPDADPADPDASQLDPRTVTLVPLGPRFLGVSWPS